MKGKGERSAEGKSAELGLCVREAHLAKFGIIDEVWPVAVDESTEGQAILPAGQRERASGPSSG